jgi:CRP/FNR family cyclic AMP-dependent transcriptional regulator
MRKHSKNRRLEERKAATLFSESTKAPVAYLGDRYPFHARLNHQRLARLKAITGGTLYSRGAILFTEGQRPDGVYVILEGRVKLSVSSAHGRCFIIGFFGPGTVFGLAAAISGRPQGSTAEIVKTTRVALVPHEDLLRQLQGSEEAAFQASEMVSEEYFFILSKIKVIELAQSAEEKLVRFLLGLNPEAASLKGEVRLELDLSQEAVAQMIGVSRETVSRLFSRLKKRRILDWKRSALVIRDRTALEKFLEVSGEGSKPGRACL